MPTLLNFFFTYSEQPGVRFFQGAEEIKELYYDQQRTGQPVYMIRPNYKKDIHAFQFVSNIRHLNRKAGIWRYAITPDVDHAPKNYRESDPFMLVNRTWMHTDDYTAPVEWSAYGNKVSIMSSGNEVIGMIIESPQIAEAFRQLYKLLEEGLQRRPDYDQLPKAAQYIGATSENYKQKRSTIVER